MSIPTTNFDLQAIASAVSEKAIYRDADSRYNIYQLPGQARDPQNLKTLQDQALSVACMIDRTSMPVLSDGSYKLTSNQPTLSSVGDLKETERFANEPIPGFGTAFLIATDLMVTAAHCVCKEDSNELDQDSIKRTFIVFDFKMVDADTPVSYFPKETVFKIKEVVAHAFSRSEDWADWAVFRLTEAVEGRTPLKLDVTTKVKKETPLYMLGHPAGLPLKLTDSADVAHDGDKDFFEADLDAFAGNSGSPVFDAVKKTVIGILVAGNPDFDPNRTYHHVKDGEGFEVCQRIAAAEGIRNALIG